MTNEPVDILPVDPVARLIISCNVRTGEINVGGHLDNADLCLQMLIEAGHIILMRKKESTTVVVKPN